MPAPPLQNGVFHLSVFGGRPRSVSRALNRSMDLFNNGNRRFLVGYFASPGKMLRILLFLSGCCLKLKFLNNSNVFRKPDVYFSPPFADKVYVICRILCELLDGFGTTPANFPHFLVYEHLNFFHHWPPNKGDGNINGSLFLRALIRAEGV
jgi:hypothetical protein